VTAAQQAKGTKVPKESETQDSFHCEELSRLRLQAAASKPSWVYSITSLLLRPLSEIATPSTSFRGPWRLLGCFSSQ
jgi:hypothetical protein